LTSCLAKGGFALSKERKKISYRELSPSIIVYTPERQNSSIAAALSKDIKPFPESGECAARMHLVSLMADRF
jgi:hypothetical protein